METKKAIIPHKDTAFFLAKTAKMCISLYNAPFLSDDVRKKAFPVFPQWIFLDEIPENITCIELNLPLKCKTELYFPVKLFLEQNSLNIMEEKIKFAQILEDSENSEEKLKLPTLVQEKFPMQLKIFRTGKVLLTENSWQFFEEKWHKLNGSTPQK